MSKGEFKERVTAGFVGIRGSLRIFSLFFYVSDIVVDILCDDLCWRYVEEDKEEIKKG